MFLLGLACSLIVLIFGGLLGSAPVFAVALVGIIVSIAGLGGAPQWLLLTFWVGTTAILLSLLFLPEEATCRDSLLLMGMPLRMVLMIVGVWIVPLLIWPIGFLLTFRRWLEK